MLAKWALVGGIGDAQARTQCAGQGDGLGQRPLRGSAVVDGDQNTLVHVSSLWAICQ